jgi:RND family efflux transporter MFP subunit
MGIKTNTFSVPTSWGLGVAAALIAGMAYGLAVQAQPQVQAAPALPSAQGADPGAGQGARVTVPVVTVRSGPSAEGEFALDGSLQPVRQATVAAQLGGNVLQLAVKAGDRVRAGQLVARLDGREAQTVVDRSQAALAQAQAEARNARTHAERTLELRRQGFMSQAALDMAQTQSRAADAGVEQALAGRAQARLASAHSQVVAPFDGVVLATHLDVGDLASPGRPVATIYAPGALRAVVLVPASRAGFARTAQEVSVTLPDGRSLAPSRRTEVSAADPISQTVEWRLDLSGAAVKDLMPGQTVRVRFAGGAATAHDTAKGAPTLVVPMSAVLQRGELTGVYVAQAQGFALRAVRLGTRRGAQGAEGVEVLAGLKAGDRVAVDALRAGLAGATAAP